MPNEVLAYEAREAEAVRRRRRRKNVLLTLYLAAILLLALVACGFGIMSVI